MIAVGVSLRPVCLIFLQVPRLVLLLDCSSSIKDMKLLAWRHEVAASGNLRACVAARGPRRRRPSRSWQYSITDGSKVRTR
jgi:hypothetical protein